MKIRWLIIIVLPVITAFFLYLKTRKNSQNISNYQDKEFENFLNVLKNLTDRDEEAN